MIRLPALLLEELSRATGIEHILGTAGAWLPKSIDADWAAITYTGDGGPLSRTFQRNGQPGIPDGAFPFRPGTARNAVVLSGQTTHLDRRELSADRDPTMQALYDAGFRRVQIAPMMVDGNCVGTLSLARKTDTPFRWQHLRLLTAAADWIGAQARLMQQMRANSRMAETDPLTGLANRARLMRVLDGPGTLNMPDRNGRVIGVLHVDLDRFKEVNDRYGHAVGDELLRHAAKTMQALAKPSDVVARIGGDEFIIVTRTDPDGREIARMANKIAEQLTSPFYSASGTLSSPASIGTAAAGHANMTAERLIANADLALYEIKRRGGGGVYHFTETLRCQAEERRTALEELETAIRDKAFSVHVQPVVDLTTGDIASGEVLVRWDHPTRGPLCPSDFLDTARDAQLTSRIDAIVREQGLALLKSIQGQIGAIPTLSFNFSAGTLADSELPETFLWEVLGAGLSPSDIAVEVPESALTAAHRDAVKRNMGLLAELGFSILIDDFGTGRISLQQLGQLPLSGLKLNSHLAQRLNDPGNRSILRAIFALAKELDLTVVVKGVETVQTLAELERLDSRLAQGNAIAAPLSEDSLRVFLKRLAPSTKAPLPSVDAVATHGQC